MNIPEFTREDFVAFVRSRDPDEVIDHHGSDYLNDYSSWSTCAVGKFYTSLTGERLHIGDSFPHELGRVVGERVYSYMMHSKPRTYGQLHRILEQEKQS